jgi:hypothetical protein
LLAWQEEEEEGEGEAAGGRRREAWRRGGLEEGGWEVRWN